MHLAGYKRWLRRFSFSCNIPLSKEFLFEIHKVPDLKVVISKVDKKGNDQEPIQSNSTSCPKHETGNGVSQ